MPYRQTTVAGLPAVSLSNDTIELVAIPGAGARITHLRRRAGREWLWRNPRLGFRAAPLAPPLGPTDYVDQYDSGGWDECFPTITPGRMPDGRVLPDHGELWHAEWVHELAASAEGTTWRASASCRTVPASFTRAVSLGGDGVAAVSFRYHLAGTGAAPVAYHWAAHPLFGIQPGMRLRLPGVSRARVASVHGRDDWRVGDDVAWPPAEGGGFMIPEQGGWAAMLLLTPPAAAQAELHHPDRGETLVMHWDAGEIPALGVWVNCGGWAPAGEPYWNLAVEPCLTFATGIVPGTPGAELAPILPPMGERRWGLTVTLREGSF